MGARAHQFVSSVLDDPGCLLNPTARQLLRELADYSNDDGVCWPGTAALARRLGVHYDTVYRARRRLVAAQIVIYTPGGAGRGNTGLYRILIPAMLSTRTASTRSLAMPKGPRQRGFRTAPARDKDRVGAARTSNEPVYEPRDAPWREHGSVRAWVETLGDDE